MKTLFGFADMKQGDDVCTTTTLEWRLKAMQDARAGFPVPKCAGGVPEAELKLIGAEYKEVEEAPSVVVSFNIQVMPSSAQDVTKYTIESETVITTALVSPRDKAKVVLTVTLPDPPEGDYKLAVHDILAADGSTLDETHRTAAFHVGDGLGKAKRKR